MARGMHKGPRNTRDAKSQWAPKGPHCPSGLSTRQKDFEEKQDRLSNAGSGLLYHRPGSNKK